MSMRALALAMSLAAAGADPAAAALDRGLAAHPAGAARAAWASALLVGRPYVLSPLGEGEPPDADPRWRLDAFDCVTFVETAIALGNATSVAEARRLIDDIRYDGPPDDYAHRNHYTLSQWVPANEKKGWVADATRELAGDLTVTKKVHHDAQTWAEARAAHHLVPHLPASRFPMGDFELPMVPLDEVASIAAKIPSGTIVLVVRERVRGKPYVVSHLGLFVVKGGKPYVRHASDVPSVMRVRDEPLDHFLARNARYAWKVEGLSLLSIRDDAARRRELAATSSASGRRP